MSDIQPGHNQLKSITERINRLEDEKKTIAEDIRDVYAEAKGNGFNPKALRVVIRRQRADAKKAAELAADVDAYVIALGMDGVITASQEEIAFRLHVSEQDLDGALKPLIDSGFFIASEPLAERQQDACLEKSREEDIDKTETEANASASPPDPSIPEREYFVRGREVLGKGAGAMIANLLKAKGRNVSLARAALEEASQKQKPLEYVAAICRGPPAGKPLTEFQRAQNETKDILHELGNFARGGSGSGGSDPGLLPDHSGERPQGLRSGAGEAVIDLPRGGYRTSG